MRITTVILICAVVVGSWGNPLPSSSDIVESIPQPSSLDLKESEATIDTLDNVELAGEEVTRKKKSTTTFCVEIRPSSPSQQPFQVCEPEGYGQTQKPSTSYENKEYQPAPVKRPAPTASYSAQPSSAPAYAGPTKTYSAPAHHEGYSHKDHSSAGYQHTPYTPVTAYRNAEEIDMMSRMASLEEDDNLSHSAEEDHVMRAAYGEYGGMSSYGPHQPVAFINPLPKLKKKLMAKKLGKLGGHNGLVISCQPSLTGYASSIPTSGGYSAGYRSSAPMSSYRPHQYAPPESFFPPKQYQNQGYPSIAYKQPSFGTVPVSSFSAQPFGGPIKQEEFSRPIQSSFQQSHVQPFGSSFAAQHPSQSQEMFGQSFGPQQQFSPFGSQVPFSQPSSEFGNAQVHAHSAITPHIPEEYGSQDQHYTPEESYQKPPFIRPGTYGRSSNIVPGSKLITKPDISDKGLMKTGIGMEKGRSSEPQFFTDRTPVKVHEETGSNARSADPQFFTDRTPVRIQEEVGSQSRMAPGGGWGDSELRNLDSPQWIHESEMLRSAPGGGWRNPDNPQFFTDRTPVKIHEDGSMRNAENSEPYFPNKEPVKVQTKDGKPKNTASSRSLEPPPFFPNITPARTLEDDKSRNAENPQFFTDRTPVKVHEMRESLNDDVLEKSIMPLESHVNNML